jgi:Double stranded RNA binding domain.
MLPQDKFTQLSPLWYLSKNKKSVHLQLPMNSKLRDLIKVGYPFKPY